MPNYTTVLGAVLLLSWGSSALEDEKRALDIPEPAPQPRRIGSRQPLVVTLVRYEGGTPGRDHYPHALPELIDYFEQTTRVITPVRWNEMRLDDPRIKDSHLLYLTGSGVRLQIDETSRRNLGHYLHQGGMMYAEEIRPSGLGLTAAVGATPFERQFKALIRDDLVLGSSGTDWQSIKRGHPLFHSYFEFPDGPPMGFGAGADAAGLEILEVRGRPAVILSTLNISWFWGDTQAEARDRGLQFGCNLFVYAMAQRAAISTD